MKFADISHFYAIPIWFTEGQFREPLAEKHSCRVPAHCECEGKMASAAVRTCSFLIKQHCLAVETKEFRAFVHSHVLLSGPSVKCRIPLCSYIILALDDTIFLFFRIYPCHVKTIPVSQCSIAMSPIFNPFISK